MEWNVEWKALIEKVLEIFFSYHKQLASKENFVKNIVKIVNVLKFGRMKNLAIKGKVTVLKLMRHGILHYLCSTDQSKSFSQLIVLIFIFSQYLFQ